MSTTFSIGLVAFDSAISRCCLCHFNFCSTHSSTACVFGTGTSIQLFVGTNVHPATSIFIFGTGFNKITLIGTKILHVGFPAFYSFACTFVLGSHKIFFMELIQYSPLIPLSFPFSAPAQSNFMIPSTEVPSVRSQSAPPFLYYYSVASSESEEQLWSIRSQDPFSSVLTSGKGTQLCAHHEQGTGSYKHHLDYDQHSFLAAGIL